jgi:hypothetical protein
MAKPEFEFFDPMCLAERLVGGIPGLTERILSEVWILEGSFHDVSLDRTFVAGMYACRPPGMPHGPWRSADGCRTLEIRYYRQNP